jgi:hypothetical protein
LEVRDGRPQDHDGQIHVEHVNEESDEGGAQRSLSGIVRSSVGLQILTERNCPWGHINLSDVLSRI